MQLFFLPPNITPAAQPLDAGIIEAFKDRFYAQMLSNVLDTFDDIVNAGDYCRQLTVYDAAMWTVKAYQEMPQDDIKNCFAHCNISLETVKKVSD